MVSKALAVVLSGAMIAGCVETTTYGYQYRMSQTFGGGEQAEAASPEARQLLGAARTVAFYPPDFCVNNDASAGATASQRELRASCGVLMSTLERAAERAGYEVLSWQNLRGNKRPIDFARESNVDVLFEINEFDLGMLDDSAIERTLTFFQRNAHGIDVPVQVPGSVAQRCRSYADVRDPIKPAVLTGTIDIKTVSVADGRNRWRYRTTGAQSLGRTYPQVTFTGVAKPSGAGTLLAGLGGGALLTGGILELVSAVTSNDPTTGETKFDPGNWPAYLAGVGTVVLIGGIVLSLVQGSTPAEPSAVLCLDTPMQPVAGMAAMPVPAESSSVTFQEHTNSDPLAKDREHIRDAMIADFITVLSEAHRAPWRAAPQPPVPNAAPLPTLPAPSALPPTP